MLMKKPLTYAQILRDARWQRKKVHLFNVHGGYCHYPGCEHPNRTLDVHHKVYLRGRDPWDYPDWCFEILCESHHLVIQDRMERAHLAIASNPELLQYCISRRIENPGVLKSEPPRKEVVEKVAGIELFRKMREALTNGEIK